MSTSLIPVKNLAGSKTRLAPSFGRAQLEELCLAMLRDLIESLSLARRVDRVVIVTPDARVAEAAEAAGAEALTLDDPGLNPSLSSGAHALDLADDEPLLVVLGDVAAARAEDFDRMYEILDELGAPAVVIAEADDAGTAALLRVPHDVIDSQFGEDSARRHREAAARAGVPYRSVRLPSLGLDLDDRADVDRLLASVDRDGAPDLGVARRTRALLAGAGARGNGGADRAGTRRSCR